MKPQSSNDPAGRRHAAEERLTERPGTSQPQTEADLRRLQQELEVHQIELEMLNAELLAAQPQTAAAAEQHADLYDFAPVGCFTLAATGTIRLVNLTGAKLMGLERAALVGAVERHTFDTFLALVFATECKPTCEVALAKPGQPPANSGD